MEFAIIFGLAFGALVCATRAGRIARQRRRKFGEGFALGMILGPIGVRIASQLPKPERGELGQRDRHCYLLIAEFADCRGHYAR